jgi:hypothetical protein
MASTWPRQKSEAKSSSPRQTRPAARAALSQGWVEFQGSEAGERAQQREHPEAQHDLGLGPAAFLEMVVDRRHEEDRRPSPKRRLVNLNQPTWMMTDTASTRTPRRRSPA